MLKNDTGDTWWQNILFPDFGKAGMPYAKSVRSVKALHGAKPDPSLLFDRQYSLLGYRRSQIDANCS